MSKKYKLKKRYPSLPKSWKVGEIVKQSYGPHCYSSTSFNIDYRINIPKDEVENNPEFWEPVEEKDYEILSFMCGGYQLFERINKTKFKWKTIIQSEDFILKNSEDYKIHSVRRLSDGEVFTIGDRLSLNKKRPDEILAEIRIIDSKPRFRAQFQIDLNHSWGSSYTLDYIQHCPSSLFTTEDGVDIYEGDKFCVINSANDRIFDRLGGDGLFYKSEQVRKRCFSTKEKAQEWIDLNKSQYSKADITNAVHAVGELGYNHHSNKTCLILQADDLFKELKI